MAFLSSCRRIYDVLVTGVDAGAGEVVVILVDVTGVDEGTGEVVVVILVDVSVKNVKHIRV